MKGILFRPELIQAIVEGRKTVTRRVDKLACGLDNAYDHKWITFSKRDNWWLYKGRSRITDNLETFVLTPRYQVGEVVYIKEAWQVLDMDTRTLVQPIHRIKAEYKLDGFRIWTQMPATISYTIPDKWHSPLHLAEITARHFIKITDVRAERLQEITREEINKEGIPHNASQKMSYRNDGYDRLEDFRVTWDSINKPPFDWQSNPWVWVYHFGLTSEDKGE